MRITRGSDNVFRDIGFPPADAENLRIRTEMMVALRRYIRSRKLTQEKAAKRMGVARELISGLMLGEINQFTVDMLIKMVAAAGLRVALQVKQGSKKVA